MKSDVIQYERVYSLIKSKIECGIIPVGARLPGRSVLCREFGTSERTIRRSIELLEQDGFIEITQRKRPTVISAFAAPDGRALQNTKKTDAAMANNLLQTGILICYPILKRGLSLCSGDDWRTPELLYNSMNPELPEEFWRRSELLWRFFIARNENELLLRVVDSLGFRQKGPVFDSLEERRQYLTDIKKLLNTIKEGGQPKNYEYKRIFSQYRIDTEQDNKRQFFQLVSPCQILAKADGVEQKLSLVQERYSTVCLDLLGLIAIGRYQPGDRLPTHDQLQYIYGVSRDTSVKAVRVLKEWGVVTAAPRRGISVVLDLDGLKKIQIEPEAIACHVRRYLDSLELLSLTVERAALHAAAYVDKKDAERLKHTLIKQLEMPYEHQLIPRILLDFIIEHIQHDALCSIYKILARNFSIGRSIPKLVSADKNLQNCNIYRQCIESADILISGDNSGFAKAVSDMFGLVAELINNECKRLGYWNAAMKVYDGSALWN